MKTAAERYAVALARVKPSKMSKMVLDSDSRMCIEEIALGIFTDMTNAGAGLQQTLAAIYLSGAENAVSALKEETK